MQDMFSGASVPTLGLGLTFFAFFGVVPFLSLIAFMIVKIHCCLYRRGRSGTHTEQSHAQQSRQRREQPDEDVYLKLKAELEVGPTRYEMHGDDLRHEKSDEDEVKELPGIIGTSGMPSHHWRYEVEGDSHLEELDASR